MPGSGEKKGRLVFINVDLAGVGSFTAGQEPNWQRLANVSSVSISKTTKSVEVTTFEDEGWERHFPIGIGTSFSIEVMLNPQDPVFQYVEGKQELQERIFVQLDPARIGIPRREIEVVIESMEITASLEDVVKATIAFKGSSKWMYSA